MNSQTALADLIAGLETRMTATAEARAANPPCLDPWCANGANPCGHTPDAHMAHHGAAAIIAGEPITTQASTRIANHESQSTKPPANDWPLPTVEIEQAERAGLVVRPESPAIIEQHNSPPPSTVAEMRDVLTALDASRPRSQQTTLGPSELGTPCQRQIAYKLAGVPRQPDKRPPWAPMQGTAMHVLMAEALEFHNQQLGRQRWIVEDRLQIDDEISGSGDAYDGDHAEVVDWKYVGKSTLAKVKRKTIPNDQLVKPEYRVQAHLYGLGHERAGRDVRWIRLVFLARTHDYGDSTEWTEPYRPEIAIRALDRYYATQDLINALDVSRNPALWAVVPAAPSEDTCAWCPFRRPGGPADATGCPGNLDKTSKANQQLLANM